MKRHIISLMLLVAMAAIVPVSSMAQLTTDKRTQNMGTLKLYTENTTTFTLKNTSAKAVTISRIVPSSSQIKATCSPMVVPAGGTTLLSLSYKADLVGRFTHAILVYCEGSDTPLTVQVKGKVYINLNDAYSRPAPKAEGEEFGVSFGPLTLQTDNIEFDYVNDGDVVSRTIAVTNNGEENCMPNLLHLPGYLTVQASPRVLRPGRKGYLTITLDSRKLNHSLGLTQDIVYVSSYEGESVAKDREIPVSIVLFDTATVERSNRAPVIQLSTDELVMPESTKSKVKGTVSISNTGRSPLEIRSLQVFHPAINVALPKTTIAPGETVDMKVTLVKKYRDLSNARYRILMITNDYRKPAVLVGIR
ncbi:MAG: DUF1573 domain-containing protein [Bacteroidaceae bacterium]|nr:DUF1573 domain-containing protein [Bacteroidaceae bacterium]